MKDECERCTKPLFYHSTAYICSHGCTFCSKCSEEMDYICPNCRGELVMRPRSGGDPLSCSIYS
ncbi:DUF1272 domain-containing protein [Evansella halocellulosilytica]|uniref:DUF1272 domain-containing protein n=1 Tax=Evansella halocellulosilytica TaxID=2011013 RepID=UPI0027B9B721|nr:DUF1272 domain-containing protein [Evansella halocellulosilytica]